MNPGEENNKVEFEEALAKIERIISQLESGKLSLEESLVQFQEGIKMVNVCQKDLEQAEQKIEILISSQDGNKFKEVKVSDEGVSL